MNSEPSLGGLQGPPPTFSNSSRMGGGKCPDTQSAASRPSAMASATEETPKRHMTESVSPYTTCGDNCELECACPSPPLAPYSTGPTLASAQ